MPDWEDLYQVLEVSPEAGPDEIRHAYSAKVMAFHPDRLFGVADELKRVAEEKLKAVNEAYEILRDADKRAEFHDDWLSRNSPPRPEVDPPVLRFDDVAAGRTMTGHFVIRNSGGPYDSIHVSNPESWVNISGYSSLSEDDELPLRIDVEVRPDQWGKSYAETISVGLDDQEIQVPVELYTRAVPRSGRAPETTTFRTGPAPPLTSTARRGPAPDLDTHQPGHLLSYASEGLGRGLNWGAIGGAAAMALAAAAVVLSMDEHLLARVMMTPAFALVAGLVGAIGGGLLGAVMGLAVGTVLAWIRKADAR
jgi:curved DNA-binding protein CbpA